ncbi:hypothetical protein PRIPAC_74176 [Pristionchus pacificus]|uniref:Uncharacterized protein n=1 Tax=Pristionchus pacificus TaxID=54126 RepID=A0A454XQK0_PRIPA|nr:hypothetical protein PRIPAC_74176 [Pristionchus pacificus]|eukprot:PDM71543.1 hypothetical protein PRIPAC_37950 [Pristionchus pacificus]
MRSSLILLLLLGLACAAPLSANHEEEAKKFLGKLFVATKNGDKWMLFDMLLKKFDHYVPGFITEEITEAFKAYAAIPYPSVRIARLDVDALMFVNKLIDDLPAFPTKVRPFVGDVKTLRLKVEALPSTAKTRVFDNLVAHAKGFCSNLPGFAECEKMLQYIE